MWQITKSAKCCGICGKDVALEHCITDEHGLSVHSSCHEKRILLKAAAAEIELWRRTARKRDVA